jgi:muramoyltetrapeptide carboxypeptidase
MQKLPQLKPGDSVEIIAPSSRCTDTRLQELKALLKSWDLNCIVDERIFGDDLLCANTDEIRFELLKKALERNESKAIICARGGYGSMRLIPRLATLTPPAQAKLFVGMSDITALSLYLERHWHWPTLHGGASPDIFSKESLRTLKAFLFNEVKEVSLNGRPLNAQAQEVKTLKATITGGNLCLVQTSLATHWEIDARKKFILLEEVGERGYRVDRMLEQLKQAGAFDEASAIIFGDFLKGNEPDGSSLIAPVLNRFAETIPIPVVQIEGVGHGHTNVPIPLGVETQLQLGKEVKLTYCPGLLRI